MSELRDALIAELGSADLADKALAVVKPYQTRRRKPLTEQQVKLLEVLAEADDFHSTRQLADLVGYKNLQSLYVGVTTLVVMGLLKPRDGSSSLPGEEKHDPKSI